MWYLEVLRDTSETAYTTVFSGLYRTEKEAKDEGNGWRGLVNIKFIPIRSEVE